MVHSQDVLPCTSGMYQISAEGRQTPDLTPQLPYILIAHPCFSALRLFSLQHLPVPTLPSYPSQKDVYLSVCLSTRSAK